MRIAITGATGFIGSALVAVLREDGNEVTRISRSPHAAGRGDVRWDPAAGLLAPADLEGVEAVIHLAGEPLAERWTDDHKREVRGSRIRGTRLIAETIASLARPPRVLISASAIGIYGDRGDEPLDESSAPGAHLPGDEGARKNRGASFLAQVGTEWEAAAEPAARAGIRVVHPRLGVVVGADGGALARLLPPFKLGAGGKLGDGTQWMSWIAHDDVMRAIQFLLATDSLRGPVNIVAPNPVTNADFAQALGHVLHRPSLATVPAFAIKLMFGEMAEAVLLAGQRVLPKKLLAAGFEFRHPELEAALRFELARGAGAAA